MTTIKTTMPAVLQEEESMSDVISGIWKSIIYTLYRPVHSIAEVKEKLLKEIKDFPDGDSHFVITELIKEAKKDGHLLDAIMQEHKSYADAFDYFSGKAKDVGFKMKQGYYLDNRKALKLAEEYFLLDDAKEYYEKLFHKIQDEKVKKQLEMELRFDGDLEKYRAGIREEILFEEKFKKENPEEFKARYEKKTAKGKKKKSAVKSTVKKKEWSARKDAATISVSVKTEEEKASKDEKKTDSPVKEAAPAGFSQMSIWDLM